MYVPLNTVQRAVSVVDSLADVPDPARFADTALPALARLISCDVLTYHELDIDSEKVHYAEFRQSERLRDCFDMIPAGHRMVLTISPPGGTIIGIVFTRAAYPFTDTERTMLAVVRGPIMRAFLRAHRRWHTTTLLTSAATLTGRERQVLEMVTLGRTNGAIARALDVSPRTVAKHLEHIYRKLEVGDRAAAVARVLR